MNLTAKEKEAVRLLLQGFSNREIANRVNNTEQVVKNRMRLIFDKVGASNRAELVSMIIAHPKAIDGEACPHCGQLILPS